MVITVFRTGEYTGHWQHSLSITRAQQVIPDKHQNLSILISLYRRLLSRLPIWILKHQMEKKIHKTDFFSQSFLDISLKLKHLEKGHLTSQEDVLTPAYHVYHHRDKEPHNKNLKCLPRISRPPQQLFGLTCLPKPTDLWFLLQTLQKRVTESGLPDPFSHLTLVMSKVLSRGTLRCWLFLCS